MWREERDFFFFLLYSINESWGTLNDAFKNPCENVERVKSNAKKMQRELETTYWDTENEIRKL